MNWYKNKTILAVILLVILALGGWLIMGRGDNEADEVENVIAALEAGPVEVMGTIECLPYMSGDEDGECVKGLRGNDERFYALNTTPIKFAERNMGRGTEVIVKGTYQPADTTSEEASVFEYEGVIVVETLTEVEE